MLTNIDYQLIDKRLKEMEEQLKDVELQVEMLKACIGAPSALSSGNFMDAGLPQTWKESLSDKQDVEE